MRNLAKIVTVLMGLVAAGVAHAGNYNSYNCPGYASGSYIEFTDSAGDVTDICPTTTGELTYNLTSYDFITGYSGSTPIYESVSGHVASAVFHIQYGDGVSAYTDIRLGCEWVLAPPVVSHSATATCFNIGGPYDILHMNYETP